MRQKLAEDSSADMRQNGAFKFQNPNFRSCVCVEISTIVKGFALSSKVGLDAKEYLNGQQKLLFFFIRQIPKNFLGLINAASKFADPAR